MLTNFYALSSIEGFIIYLNLIKLLGLYNCSFPNKMEFLHFLGTSQNFKNLFCCHDFTITLTEFILFIFSILNNRRKRIGGRRRSYYLNARGELLKGVLPEGLIQQHLRGFQQKAKLPYLPLGMRRSKMLRNQISQCLYSGVPPSNALQLQGLLKRR